jgi:alkaline phosphatase
MGIASASGERDGVAAVDSEQAPRAKNVILLIGDGMGLAQRQAARLIGGGSRDALVMDTLPYAGLVSTGCADPEAAVTDSAAAATALATGVKTINGAVSVDPLGRSLPTVLEWARAGGKSTGLVTTCQVTDATPAAFAAHVVSRGDQVEIARQYIEETGVDVILGGGEDWWRPAATLGSCSAGAAAVPVAGPAQDSTERQGNLIARAQELGYDYVGSAEELHHCRASKLLGLFDRQELFRQAEDGPQAAYDPAVSLEAMTRRAIEILSRNPGGFFLMVEEAAIDRMGHYHNAPLAIRGVLELDRAVAVAVSFATLNPETLVIVTADHECGGLTVDNGGDPSLIASSPLASAIRWSADGHTAVGVPLTASGPGADRLAGQYENTHVFLAMMDAMGLDARHERPPRAEPWRRDDVTPAAACPATSSPPR